MYRFSYGCVYWYDKLEHVNHRCPVFFPGKIVPHGLYLHIGNWLVDIFYDIITLSYSVAWTAVLIDTVALCFTEEALVWPHPPWFCDKGELTSKKKSWAKNWVVSIYLHGFWLFSLETGRCNRHPNVLITVVLGCMHIMVNLSYSWLKIFWNIMVKESSFLIFCEFEYWLFHYLESPGEQN